MDEIPIFQSKQDILNFVFEKMIGKEIFVEVGTKRRKLHEQIRAGGISDKSFIEKIQEITSKLEEGTIIFHTKEEFKEGLKRFYLNPFTFNFDEYRRIWLHEMKHFERVKEIGMKPGFWAIFFMDSPPKFATTCELTEEATSTWSAIKYLESMIYVADIPGKGEDDKAMIAEARETIDALKARS